tara:strand:+ start:1298 stop:2698 length:1401 start_codon:yes stop_codon:yes gene_type:complete
MYKEWNFENSYLKLPKIFYTKTSPDIFPSLKIIFKNEELIKKLNIKNDNFDDFLINSITKKNINSFSQAYAGHQFGHFTILGDGRALFLGEHLNSNQERYDIQLKGSGKTPYSRNGDGKGTLKSMLREYIISEAMFKLNIKTTRSLCLLKTGEKILRNYYEDGGILVRVAKSHIRIGTLQYAKISKEKDNIESLLKYTIKRLYPNLENEKDKYLKLYEKIIRNQINLILDWQRVGFIHGVMNTDNTSLSGETIDYGPCAFLDEYDPNKVFSSIDHKGRYSFYNQPRIIMWNLARMAETFLHLIDNDENLAIKKIENILIKYENKFSELWLIMMKNKIGINQYHEKDITLIKELLDLMHVYKLDYTNTFIDIQKNNLNKYKFMNNWNSKLKERKKLNKNFNKIKTNPFIIPRNHIIENLLNNLNINNLNNIKKFINYLDDPYCDNVPEIYTKQPEEGEKVYETFCGT